MVRINGEDWNIIICEPCNRALATSAGYCALGVCDDNTKTIYIQTDLEREKMRKVLCHELTHAAMFSYNVVLDYWTEELVADLIATYGEQIAGETERVFDYLAD